MLAIIGEYDGLVVRSGVTVDEDLIAAAKSMRIVGRAGTGERRDRFRDFRVDDVFSSTGRAVVQL